jgi:hypothetical protein
MKENVFSYQGDRGQLVPIFYRLLMTGKLVSYEDVLTEFDGGQLKASSPSNHDLYKTLKKVIPDVVKALNDNGYPVTPIQRGRNTDYQYFGTDRDPLKNIQFKAKLQDYHYKISSYIGMGKPIQFEYLPFDRKKMEIVFHPHRLMEYNGRRFAIGVSEREGREPMRKFVVALDRIKGEIKRMNAIEYIPPMPDEYSYLSNLVGVTFEEDAELTKIVLRAHDRYTFGRLTTKPMHNSQRTICTPNWKEDREYGDVELTVYPNRELVGQILSYGSFLEVMEPVSFRERIVDELRKILERY